MKKRELKDKIKGLYRESCYKDRSIHELLKENVALRAARANDLKYMEHLKKLFNDLEVGYNNKWHQYEKLKLAYNKLKNATLEDIIKCLT